MWQTFRKIIEDDFIDEEDIIAKNQYLENITIRYPYIPWGNQINLFSSRVAYAIQRLPEEHRKAALVLFANIIYLPKPILDEAWREVAFSLDRIFLGRSSLNFFRSSARSMASGLVPMIGTPAFFKASARFSGVCPPN